MNDEKKTLRHHTLSDRDFMESQKTNTRNLCLTLVYVMSVTLITSHGRH
jgi:hypothetical protein